MASRAILLLVVGALSCLHALARPDGPNGPAVQGSLIGSPIIDTNAAAVSAIPTNRPMATGSLSNPAGASGHMDGDYVIEGFDRLSAFPARLTFKVVNAATMAYVPTMTGKIPDDIQTLEGKRVVVRGFMLPLKQVDGRVTEFLLLKNQALCCFGMSPNINEWVHVRLAARGVKSMMDQPLSVYGTLHVGEFRENGQMAGIYQMDAQRVVNPHD